jgi:hypothetical protein
VIRIKLVGGGTAMAMDFATKAKDTTATRRGQHIYTVVGIIRNDYDGAAAIKRFLGTVQISASPRK